jgi:sporulation protein YlmC with PRC-barrel domain
MEAKNEKGYEADNVAGVNHEGVQANSPVQRLTATSIIGDKVQNPEGDHLGKVENVMINLDDGRVEYVVVEMGSFLGIGGKLYAIPFSELHLDPAKKVFIIRRTKEYLKKIPGFDKLHWPDTNAHEYYKEVNTYWGSSYQSSDY